MQLRYEQLTSHLQKNLAPIYLISGDVPLLMQEACDAIRATARNHGYQERQVFHVETGFAWQELLNTADHFSLFSEKQLLELRITTNTLGDAGSKALQKYVARLPTDKVLLISMGKIEASAQRAAWFQAVANAGAVMQLWPLEKAQLPRWVSERVTRAGLRIDSAGIQLLADYAEGNLLAAQQEIEKLNLIFAGTQTLTVEDIAQVINDSARFDIFALVDAALQGDAKRVLRILAGLKAEGAEPVLIIWALAREIRSLASQAQSMTQGATLEKVLQEQKVWEKRKPLVRAALQRHSVKTLRQLLKQVGNIDRVIKGVELGNVWDELETLGLALSRNGS